MKPSTIEYCLYHDWTKTKLQNLLSYFLKVEDSLAGEMCVHFCQFRMVKGVKVNFQCTISLERCWDDDDETDQQNNVLYFCFCVEAHVGDRRRILIEDFIYEDGNEWSDSVHYFVHEMLHEAEERVTEKDTDVRGWKQETEDAPNPFLP